MDDNDVTTDEAAKILEVTPAHVRWYHRNGYLPGRRMGKWLLVFKRADVVKLKDNKPKKPGRPPKKKPEAAPVKKPVAKKRKGKGA